MKVPNPTVLPLETPSFCFWFFSFRAARQGSGSVAILMAVTSWCQNCPAERQGRHPETMRNPCGFDAFPDFCVLRFIFGSGFWDRIWSILCVVDPIYVWWIPSEVAFEIAGRWRIKNHPRAGLQQLMGSTTHQSSRGRFSWNAREESFTNLHGPLDGGPAPRRENV